MAENKKQGVDKIPDLGETFDNPYIPINELTFWFETLEEAMLANPGNWQKHYHGDDKQLALARKYSFSDRARYYIGQPEVVASMNKLFDNLREYRIPMNMLHQ